MVRVPSKYVTRAPASALTPAGLRPRASTPKTFSGSGGRVFDIYLKDVQVTCARKRTTTANVPIGAGEANLKRLLKALKDLKYVGVIAVETDADLKDTTEFVTGAVKFIEANKP